MSGVGDIGLDLVGTIEIREFKEQDVSIALVSMADLFLKYSHRPSDALAPSLCFYYTRLKKYT